MTGMVVQCPACGAGHPVDPERIKPRGTAYGMASRLYTCRGNEVLLPDVGRVEPMHLSTPIYRAAVKKAEVDTIQVMPFQMPEDLEEEVSKSESMSAWRN